MTKFLAAKETFDCLVVVVYYYFLKLVVIYPRILSFFFFLPRENEVSYFCLMKFVRSSSKMCTSRFAEAA